MRQSSLVRRLRGCAVAVVVATAASAQAQTTLFSDTFEGGAGNWTVQSGTWAIGSDGSAVYSQTYTGGDARAHAGSTAWTDQTVQARVKLVTINGSNKLVALLARYTDQNNHYAMNLRTNGTLELRSKVAGSSTTLATGAVAVTTGTWYTLRFEIAGTALRGYVNGALIASTTSSARASGKIALATNSVAAVFDDVVVTGGGAATATPTATATTRATATPTTRVTATPTTRATATPTTRATATPTTRATATPTATPTTRPTATPTAASGAIYVAPDGTDGAAGTLADPTTLYSAVTRVAAGGTIYMRGGTYEYAVTVTIARGNDGTASARKQILPYGSEKPILDFAAQAFLSSNRGLQLNGHYWRLYGLEVKNAGDNGIFIGGNNNIVERCATHHNRDSGLQLGRHASTAPSSEWPANNLILNCDSYDNYDPDNGEDADGFACKLTTGAGNVFRGCVARNNIDDGWDLYTKSDTGAISPVTIENCVAHNNGNLSSGGTTTDSDGNGFKLGGEGISVNHVVRRSVAFSNKKHGFTFNSNPGSIAMTNNTSIRNGESNLKFDEGTHVHTNNLSFEGASSDKSAGTDVSSTNVWWKNNASSNGKGLVVSAADFVSLTPSVSRNADGSVNLGTFLRLVAGSDLVNSGTPSGTDIGAVESQ